MGNDNQPLQGRAGIVTGASSGIGRVISQTLGRAGMELWLVGRSDKKLGLTARSIEELDGPTAHCVAMDLAEPGVLANLVAQVGERHPYLFALVNNAGVMYPEPILDAKPDRWREMFAINLFTPLESCQAAVIQMRKHGRPGHLINISSLAARLDSNGAYGASKVALNHAGSTLRKELELDDIRITTIIPGGFNSNLARGFTRETLEVLSENLRKRGLVPGNPEAKRFWGEPQQIADTVKFILQQPIEINFEEIVIRPAASFELD